MESHRFLRSRKLGDRLVTTDSVPSAMPYAWCELREERELRSACHLESGITEASISHLNAFPTVITWAMGVPTALLRDCGMTSDTGSRVWNM